MPGASDGGQVSRFWGKKIPYGRAILSNTLVITYSLKMFPEGLAKVSVCNLCNTQPTWLSSLKLEPVSNQPGPLPGVKVVSLQVGNGRLVEP